LMRVLNEGDHFIGEPIVSVEVVDHAHLKAALPPKVNMVLGDDCFFHGLCLQFVVRLHPKDARECNDAFGFGGCLELILVIASLSLAV
jgi:hypothetical protein